VLAGPAPVARAAEVPGATTTRAAQEPPPPTPNVAGPVGVAPTASASARPRELPSPLSATNTCASCHSTLSDTQLRAPARENATSAHRDDRLGCVGCHKGDPRDPTANAHSKALGFDPHPTEAEIPKICGGCHSDANFMRRINSRLGVGQAALYNLSLHGRLAAAGDDNAPTCATCHGKHDIVSPASPLSRVNRANVAKLCAGCHADPKRMAKYDIKTDQYAKWQKSVHGVAFAKGNPNAPTCTGCHGAHASTPPDAASVAHACGRCHEDEMTLFEQSPHSQAFRKRGITQCVACHSNHDVAPASPLLVGMTPEAACSKCHSNDEKPRQVALDISAMLSGARDRAAAARTAVKEANEAGLKVVGASFAIDKITTAELKVRSVVHTLDPKRVEAAIGDIDKAVDATQKLVSDAREVRRSERRDYYVALALAGLFLLSLSAKAVQLDRRRRRDRS
jgi:predicted CXXCH cytochrome family protein